MKNKLFYISFLSLLLISACQTKKSEDTRGYIVKVGDKVPKFAMKLTTGESISISELKGKVVVLQFTASWCSVCRKEMPHLEKEVWQKFKDDDFILIGVDYDEAMDKVIEFQKKMKTTYPMALDPNGDIFALFAHKKSGVTRNVVIDKNGKIVFLTRLFDKEEFETMKKTIRELLNDN